MSEDLVFCPHCGRRTPELCGKPRGSACRGFVRQRDRELASAPTLGPYHAAVSPVDGRRHRVGRRGTMLYTSCGEVASWDWPDDDRVRACAGCLRINPWTASR